MSIDIADRSRHRRTVLAIVVSAMIVFLPGLFWGLPFGKFIVGAGVILDGGVPYTDFWTMYAPGTFYLVAALFKVFGQDVVVQGAAVIAIRAVTAGVFFHLLRRVGTDRRLAGFLAILFIGMFWETSPELSTYPPALLLLLLAMGRILKFFAGRNPRGPIEAGFLLGCAAIFKHDVAAYAATAFILSIYLIWLLALNRHPARIYSPLTASVELVGTAITPIIPVAIFLASTAGVEAWDGLIMFPALIFPKVFSEPFPPLVPHFFAATGQWLRNPVDLVQGRNAFGQFSSWTVCNFPQIIFFIGIFVLARQRRTMTFTTLATTVLCLSLLPFFWMASHVQQNTHPHSMAIVSMFLCGMAWNHIRNFRFFMLPLRPTLSAMAIVWGISLIIPSGFDLFLMVRNLADSQPLNLPTARFVRVSSQDFDVYHSITMHLADLTAPKEPIWAGVARHDAIVITDMRFYYLAQRPGPCRYYELHTGVTDRSNIQAQIERAIETNGVRYVVLWHFGVPSQVLDEVKAKRVATITELGSERLDRYIAATFEPIAEYGEYVLLRRKTE